MALLSSSKIWSRPVKGTNIRLKDITMRNFLAITQSWYNLYNKELSYKEVVELERRMALCPDCVSRGRRVVCNCKVPLMMMGSKDCPNGKWKHTDGQELGNGE